MAEKREEKGDGRRKAEGGKLKWGRGRECGHASAECCHGNDRMSEVWAVKKTGTLFAFFK